MLRTSQAPLTQTQARGARQSARWRLPVVLAWVCR